MAKNPPPGGDERDAADLADTVKASAQQIWLAGLGAFSKAQEEGGKVFEALVKEGANLQRKTQTAAEDRLAEAASRMTSFANDLSSKAAGQWDKVEGLFEERLARSLRKLGVPAAGELQALQARVEQLERQLARVSRGGASPSRQPPPRPARPTAARGAAATPRKRTPSRKSAD